MTEAVAERGSDVSDGGEETEEDREGEGKKKTLETVLKRGNERKKKKEKDIF